MKSTHPVLAIVAASALAAAPAFAASVSGEANIAGTVTVNNAGVTFSNVVITGPETGSFVGSTSATLKPLIGPPTTGAVDIPQFAVFTNPAGDVSFDLQNIFAGTGTAGPCSSNNVGNVCTPAGSPFTLVQSAPDQVTLSLALSGIAYTGSAATGYSEAPFTFTSLNVLLPGTITGIIAEASTSTGFSNSFSATISVVETPQEATQSIINSVSALYTQGVLNGGQGNSLTKQLQQATKLMNAGKNAGAIDSLNSFIAEVNDLLSSGVLTPSQANPLISAAQAVVARLS